MSEFSVLFAVGLVVIGVWMVGVTLLRTTLACYSLQTVVLGLLAAEVGGARGELAEVFVGTVFLMLKGLLIPWYLNRVIARIGSRRDDGLVVAAPILMILTLAGFSALLLVRPFTSVVPASALPAVGLLLVGMVLIMTRRLAVSQIIGFLVLENGIFLYTISQPHPMPALVEMGVLLDVLMWTMVSGVLVFQIRSSFESIDVTELRELRG